MSATVSLVHPGTGREVVVQSRAELKQSCLICGSEMKGTPIVTVNGARYCGKLIGWFHLSHLAVVLMAAPATKQRAAEIRKEDAVWSTQSSSS